MQIASAFTMYHLCWLACSEWSISQPDHSLTVISHGQPSQAVVAVNVHAGIVQHDVRPEAVEVTGQPLRQTPSTSIITEHGQGSSSPTETNFAICRGYDAAASNNLCRSICDETNHPVLERVHMQFECKLREGCAHITHARVYGTICT